MSTRVAGKRGRLPAQRLAMGFLHHYATLPKPQYPVDVSGGITDWGMLGNGPDPTCTTHPDGVGDCTFAGRQHYRMAKATRDSETETWEPADALVAEYLTYNHGADQGANIARLLLDWFHAGKILAFAPVDHTNPSAMDEAMQAFSGLYCGVQLTDDADDLFSNHQPWTVADGQQPNPDEGHCIVKVIADGHTDVWVTWGGLQKSTTGWTAACLDEAWVIITEEDAHNVNLTELRADIAALGGAEQAA
jgi:hypothetical protein